MEKQLVEQAAVDFVVAYTVLGVRMAAFMQAIGLDMQAVGQQAQQKLTTAAEEPAAGNAAAEVQEEQVQDAAAGTYADSEFAQLSADWPDGAAPPVVREGITYHFARITRDNRQRLVRVQRRGGIQYVYWRRDLQGHVTQNEVFTMAGLVEAVIAYRQRSQSAQNVLEYHPALRAAIVAHVR